MKLYLFAIAIVCLSATLYAQEPPTKPTTTAPTTQDPAELQKQFEKEQRDIRFDLETKGKAIEDLKQKLDKLPANADLQRVITQVEQLTQLTKALDAYNKEAKRGEVKLDQARYEAGVDLLKNMIDKAGTLKVTTQLGSSLTDFQTLLNPTANPAFEQELRFLKNKLQGTNQGILGANGTSSLPPWLSNPYVSLAFTVGSLIFSKYRGEDNKLDRAANIACVFDYTSRAGADLRFVQASINNLDEQVGTFQKKAIQSFQDYAEGLEKKTTWDEYKRLLSVGDNSLSKAAIKTYFEQFTTDVALVDLAKDGALPQKLSKVRFQLEKVKGLLQEYEVLLKQVDDFFGGFSRVVQKNLDETAAMTFCNEGLRNGTKSSLERTKKSLEGAREEFKKAYSLDLLLPNKSVLYGISER